MIDIICNMTLPDIKQTCTLCHKVDTLDSFCILTLFCPWISVRIITLCLNWEKKGRRGKPTTNYKSSNAPSVLYMWFSARQNEIPKIWTLTPCIFLFIPVLTILIADICYPWAYPLIQMAFLWIELLWAIWIAWL